MSFNPQHLFPPTIVVRDSIVPGNPDDLLPSEVHYVARAVPKRIREFAAGRACARAALAEFGIVDVAIPVAADRRAIWPAGFLGSITHTSGFCAAAVAPLSTVLALGLDSEVVGAPPQDLWATICRPEELTWVEALESRRRSAAVTLLFSAKEAFYKCQYPVASEWLDFHDVCIELNKLQEFGEFRASAARSIGFARFVQWPLVGRYVFHGQFVSTGFCVAAQ